MPPTPAWLARLPQIRAALARLDTPVLGRAEVEKLFGLRRRQALRLLTPLVRLQAGRTGLVERAALLAWLDSLQGKKPVVLEAARRQKLDRSLELQLATLAREAEAHRRPVALPQTGEDGGSWPPGVNLVPGELRIRYSGAEDLLGRILALTELAAADPDRFAAQLESLGLANPPESQSENEEKDEAKP